ncbi:MAG: preprotein translocase subunit SecG [Synergistaceae bacterium]|jgi:preprotein translocase subunit SecG|nr:preprotein translocase subunit SecG [Synergistaceae bacterium]
MKVFLSLIHIALAVGLMAVVLLQQRKTGGFSGIFGGGTQADTGGQWQRFTILTKITVVLTTLFMVSSLVLVIL